MQSIEPVLFFSRFSNVCDARQVCTSTTSFPDFVDALVQLGHEVRANKDGAAINFSDYAGKDRLRRNIVAVCAVTLDIDAISIHGLRTLREQLKKFKSTCYSTFSHLPGKPKVRVIVPLEQAVRVEAYREYALRLVSMLAVQCDRISLDPNQLYYLPCRPESDAAEHFIDCNVDVAFLNFGKPFPLAELERLAGASESNEAIAL